MSETAVGGGRSGGDDGGGVLPVVVKIKHSLLDFAEAIDVARKCECQFMVLAII